MEQTARRRSHISVVGAFEEPTTDLEPAPYGNGYGNGDDYGNDDGYATTPHYTSHEPIPLFLSDPDGEPDPHEFTRSSDRRRAITMRILAVAVAASAAAALAVVYHSDVARVLIANAKASINSAIAEQTAAAQPPSEAVRKVPLKDPARVANPIVLARADAREMSPPPAPSREAIASAYQSAMQSQGPAPTAVAAVAPAAPALTAAPTAAPVAAAAPVKTLDPDTLATLMSRAKSMLAVGDIPPARLLLERAANAQDATAAFLLAQTYDPVVLGTRDIRTITPDPAIARDWYQKAARLGSAEAQARLAQLKN